MSSLFKSPPKPPKPPRVPNEKDLEKSRKRSVAEQMKRSGRLSTLLSDLGRLGD